MPITILVVSDAVESQMFVVDDFNLRRGGEVAFEDVEAVTFKVVVGELTQFGKQLGNTIGIFHGKHSLRNSRRACTITETQRALRLLLLDTDSLAQRLFALQGVNVMDLGYVLNSLAGMYKPPIGSFADLMFEVSSAKVLTYDDYKRETKARYAKHELINQTTVLEYLGAELEEISFKMTFLTRMNVDPITEAQKVRDMCLDGVADYLILGNNVIGDNLWIIESVGEEATSWDNRGNILASSVTVKMLEYVPAVNEQ